MLVNTTFIDSIKVKRITNYVVKYNLSLFPGITKSLFLKKNAEISRTQGVCQAIYMYFLSSLAEV